MICEGCKGSGRKPHGFFSIQCDCCSGKGKLTVDDIWKMRHQWERANNASRLFKWKMKIFEQQP